MSSYFRSMLVLISEHLCNKTLTFMLESVVVNGLELEQYFVAVFFVVVFVCIIKFSCLCICGFCEQKKQTFFFGKFHLKINVFCLLTFISFITDPLNRPPTRIRSLLLLLNFILWLSFSLSSYSFYSTVLSGHRKQFASKNICDRNQVMVIICLLFFSVDLYCRKNKIALSPAFGYGISVNVCECINVF